MLQFNFERSLAVQVAGSSLELADGGCQCVCQDCTQPAQPLGFCAAAKLPLLRVGVQDRLLDELCASIERVEDLDWPLAERLVRTGLTPM